MLNLRKPLAHAATLAALLVWVSAAPATSLPPGTTNPVAVQNVTSFTGLTGGYTYTGQFATEVVSGSTNTQSVQYDVNQMVFKSNTDGSLAFLYQVSVDHAKGGAGVSQLATTGFNTFTSGPVDVAYAGKSVIPVTAFRPDGGGDSLFFNFMLNSSQPGGANAIDFFVKTGATQASKSGMTSVNGTPQGGTFGSFSPAPEPGTLTLAALGLPFLGAVCLRRLRQRSLAAG